MTPDQERWAEAIAVQRVHGERTELHVAERIASLALAGDSRGVTRWLEIAERVDLLAQSRVHGHAPHRLNS